jgi:hypothetical protein
VGLLRWPPPTATPGLETGGIANGGGILGVKLDGAPRALLDGGARELGVFGRVAVAAGMPMLTAKCVGGIASRGTSTGAPYRSVAPACSSATRIAATISTGAPAMVVTIKSWSSTTDSSTSLPDSIHCTESGAFTSACRNCRPSDSTTLAASTRKKKITTRQRAAKPAAAADTKTAADRPRAVRLELARLENLQQTRKYRVVAGHQSHCHWSQRIHAVASIVAATTATATIIPVAASATATHSLSPAVAGGSRQTNKKKHEIRDGRKFRDRLCALPESTFGNFSDSVTTGEEKKKYFYVCRKNSGVCARVGGAAAARADGNSKKVWGRAHTHLLGRVRKCRRRRHILGVPELAVLGREDHGDWEVDHRPRVQRVGFDWWWPRQVRTSDRRRWWWWR